MENDLDVPALAADDIANVPESTPEFRAWAMEMFLTGRLTELTEALVIMGTARNAREALSYLSETERQASRRGIGIALCDLRGDDTPGRLFAELGRAMGRKTDFFSSDPALFHGALGHFAVPELFVSSLIEENPYLPYRASPQLPLRFENGGTPDPQLSLYGMADPVSTVSFVGMQAEERKARHLIRRARELWEEALGIAKGGSPLATRKIKTRLQKVLYPLFGDYVWRLERHRSVRDDLTLLTLMSWVTAALYYRRTGRRMLFREIPVLARNRGFGGGRIDALEVRTIGGKVLRGPHRRVLGELMKRRFRSVGHLLRALTGILGTKLEVAVIDWKFAVGDTSSGEVLDPASVKEKPLSEHAAQIERYLALSTLDHSLEVNGNHGRFQGTAHALTGEVVYFFPSRDPIVHAVSAPPPKLEEVFIAEVANRWGRAERRAAVREVNNLLVRHVIRLLGGNGKKHFRSEAHGSRSGFLFPVEGSAIPVVREYRRFVGTRDVIEVVGTRRNGKPHYEMDFGKLLDAIHAGDVKTGYFSPERGGKISCLMPGHDDPGPSMQVYLAQARFYCFACRAQGDIALHTIPSEVTIAPRHRIPAAARMDIPARSLPSIPDEHHRVMSLAQELLRAAFRGSPGEQYLREIRGINADLAHEEGAGFGDGRLISGLLDSGLTLDDLIRFGFVSISQRISSSGGIVPLLRARGMSVKDAEREIRISRGKSLRGFPYSALSERVTFPLELEGRRTSFYGRAIGEHTLLKHFKLKASKVPQGGYRMGILESEGSREVIVAEAAIDALTLIAMGHRETLALIGIHNKTLEDSIVRSGRDIAIAFDIDPTEHKTGQTETAALTERLRARGHKGGIRDFTAEFTREHRGPFKDYNQWWVDTGRKTVQRI